VETQQNNAREIGRPPLMTHAYALGGITESQGWTAPAEMLLYYASRARAQSYKHQRMLSEPGLPVWNAGGNILCARGSRIMSI
jgi:hypothetical protein